jgi:hypothetical protein
LLRLKAYGTYPRPLWRLVVLGARLEQLVSQPPQREFALVVGMHVRRVERFVSLFQEEWVVAVDVRIGREQI